MQSQHAQSGIELCLMREADALGEYETMLLSSRDFGRSGWSAFLEFLLSLAFGISHTKDVLLCVDGWEKLPQAAGEFAKIGKTGTSECHVHRKRSWWLAVFRRPYAVASCVLPSDSVQAGASWLARAWAEPAGSVVSWMLCDASAATCVSDVLSIVGDSEITQKDALISRLPYALCAYDLSNIMFVWRKPRSIAREYVLGKLDEAGLSVELVEL